MKKIICSVLISMFSLNVFCTITVERFGKGQPLIIIPGFGGTAPWESTVKALESTNTCYIVTIKGLNGTQNNEDPNYSEVQKEIMNYIREEHLNHPVLIGHSFGGFLAMRIAKENPASFKKVILVDSYPFALSIFNPAFTEDFGKQQAMVVKKQLNDLPQASYEAFWKQKVMEFTSDTSYRQIIFRNIIHSDRHFVSEAQNYVLSNDLQTAIGSIQCPVTVLASSVSFQKAGLPIDTIHQRIQREFASVKNVSIHINDQAPHFIMIDNNSWFLEKLKETL